MSEVVESEISQTGILQRSTERLTHSKKWLSFVGEHMIVLETTDLGELLKGGSYLDSHRNLSASLCLGILATEGNESSMVWILAGLPLGFRRCARKTSMSSGLISVNVL